MVTESSSNSETPNNVDGYTIPEDTRCGIGKCRPQTLQRCGNLVCLTVCYCCQVFMMMTSGVFLSTQITSLEKQFGISSTTSGLLMSSTDIGYLCTVLFATHFCKRLHIPRVLGLAGMSYGFLVVVKGLLNFAKPVTLPQENTVHNSSNFQSHQFLCKETNFTLPNGSPHVSNNDKQEVSWAIAILGVLMGLQGAFISTRMSLATIYIDDNVSDHTKTPYFVGGIVAASAFGPAIALLLGGAFSGIPVDLKNTYLTPTDPRWIGAWWLGFIILGTTALLVSIPTALFPKQMPGTPKRIPRTDSQFIDQIKDLPLSVWRSLTKPIYFLTLLARCLHQFALTGLFSFGPKYLEIQFNMPAYKANFTLGIARILTTSLGVVLGSVLTGRLKLNRSKCAIFVLATYGVGAIFNSMGMVFGCDNTPIEGLDFHKQSNITTDTQCYCDKTGFLPSCGDDGLTYFSPCVAGCWNQSENVYGSCNRVEGLSVKPGICGNGCNYLIPYITVLMLMTLVGTMGEMPQYIIFIRSVADQDKALCIGLTDFTSSLLGLLPAPIVYGKVIDTTCRLMSSSAGACSLYDIVDFRYKVFGMEVGLKTASVLLMVIVFILCRIAERKGEKESGTEIQAASK